MFCEWLKSKCEDKEIGIVKARRGKIHDFLGMKLDCTEKGIAKMDTIENLQKMCKDFPVNLKKTQAVGSPAASCLFKVRDNAKKLSNHKAEIFHNMVARGLFVAKRSRGNIHLVMSFSCTRVSEPDADDWVKLVRSMKCIQQTIKSVPRLGVGAVSIAK